MLVRPFTRRLGYGYAALTHAVTPHGWRGALRADLRNAGVAAPMRVGAAVTLVLVLAGVLGQRDVAGFAALGALISAFCRPDPYPVRLGRLAVLGVAITAANGIGAVLGATGSGVVVQIAVISVLAGAAAYLMSALHIVGPGAVVFVFGAVGAQAFAQDGADVIRAMAVTAGGAVIGAAAALAPWLLGKVQSVTSPRQSLWVTFARAPHRRLLARSAQIAAAGAIAAVIAIGFGLEHPMWATMGAVATLQGVSYHVVVHRGVQRLLGNIGGALLAALLLAIPLGYWGAVVTIIAFQTVAEIASTVNYALTSFVVTPMALLLAALQAGLAPTVALDRVLDTAVGIAAGIVMAAITINGADAEHLRGLTSAG